MATWPVEMNFLLFSTFIYKWIYCRIMKTTFIIFAHIYLRRHWFKKKIKYRASFSIFKNSEVFNPMTWISFLIINIDYVNVPSKYTNCVEYKQNWYKIDMSSTQHNLTISIISICLWFDWSQMHQDPIWGIKHSRWVLSFKWICE